LPKNSFEAQTWCVEKGPATAGLLILPLCRPVLATIALFIASGSLLQPCGSGVQAGVLFILGPGFVLSRILHRWEIRRESG